MAYYDEEDVDRMIEQVTEKDETKYLKKAAKDVGKMLVDDPQIYKTFGPYWWSFKEMLKKHYTGPEAWFQGKEDDPVIKSRNFHQTLFRTVVAALYYHTQQDMHSSEHSYEHDGSTIQYTLVDRDIAP